MANASMGGAGGLEVELKFEMTAAQVRKLCRSAALKALQSAPARTKTLRATYFDTPDFQLAAREVSLRVRKESRKYVQCFKAKAVDQNASGFARHEWEWAVPGPDLDMSLLRADADIKALLKGVNFASLAPIFTSEMKRQSHELRTPGGAEISCDIDQGRVYAAQSDDVVETSVHELELELKSGATGELLRAANLITDTVPARLSSRTKAHRGHILARGNGHEWVKANHPPLAKGATAEEVLRSSVMEGLQHLIANEDCVLHRCHIEGVHQMRVATRRMRSVITTFKKLLPKGSYEELSQALKDAGSALGPARDWDVFLDEVLSGVEQGFDDEPALKFMRERAQLRQEQAYQAAQEMIHSPAYAKMLTDSLFWVANSVWREQHVSETSAKLLAPATDIAKEILAKRHARLLKAGKGLKHLTIEQRHQLRIAIKKARYAAAFFAELYPPKTTKAYLKGLKSLQEALGHLNDLATAERLMTDLETDVKGKDAHTIHKAAGLVEGWYMHADSLRENDLLKGWNAFRHAKTFW